ncbi:MAG: response regulator [Spirochaetales bacterium]|nr:response regulator [Spirochaetales bacterium]
MKRILVIDDDRTVLEAIATILEDMGHRVDGFTGSSDGEKAALSADYDLILMDLRMPGKDGAAVTESILADKPQAKVLIITGHPSDPLAKRALDAGAKGLLKKPFEIGKVLDHLSG